MGFQFAGFFAQAQPEVMQAALRTWPKCQGRLIIEPFRGIGVAVPVDALTYGDTDEEQHQAQELAYALEDELVEWSKHYPDVLFVFLGADCFGGECLYAGYTCQNGVVLAHVKDIDEKDNIALPQLLRALGAEGEGSGYFAPLTRGYFD